MSRLAIVSGGGGGMGRAVSTKLSTEGFTVAILDKDEASARSVVASLKAGGGDADCWVVNLAQDEEVKRCIQDLASRKERIDVLVNLAGGAIHRGNVGDLSWTQWREVVDANVKTAFNCCKAVIPIMKAQGGGVIINTASNFAFTGCAGLSAYASAKAAVLGFTKSVARELAPYGIRVNALAPGLTNTPVVRGRYTAPRWAEMSASIPFGRTAEPEDIAEGVSFLTSDASAFMTGQTLHVNGGMIML